MNDPLALWLGAGDGILVVGMVLTNWWLRRSRGRGGL